MYGVFCDLCKQGKARQQRSLCKVKATATFNLVATTMVHVNFIANRDDTMMAGPFPFGQLDGIRVPPLSNPFRTPSLGAPELHHLVHHNSKNDGEPQLHGRYCGLIQHHHCQSSLPPTPSPPIDRQAGNRYSDGSSSSPTSSSPPPVSAGSNFIHFTISTQCQCWYAGTDPPTVRSFNAAIVITHPSLNSIHDITFQGGGVLLKFHVSIIVVHYYSHYCCAL